MNARRYAFRWPRSADFFRLVTSMWHEIILPGRVNSTCAVLLMRLTSDVVRWQNIRNARRTDCGIIGHSMRALVLDGVGMAPLRLVR